MQHVHRISISSTPKILSELSKMGIVVWERGLITFSIDESHESWPKLQAWIVKQNAVDIVSTTFSDQEIANAQWLELMPEWHHGYPQPKQDSFGYREVTYELSEFCTQCGIGARQNAAFQMKTEPKWGRNNILQLNWVFDEYFVTPELWNTVFKPIGILMRPVMSTNGVELKTVVQLEIETEADIAVQGLDGTNCTKCGRVKYVPNSRGFFPALVSRQTNHAVKTRQYFGSGGSASKRVLISKELAGALRAEKMRGAALRPVDAMRRDTREE